MDEEVKKDEISTSSSLISDAGDESSNNLTEELSGSSSEEVAESSAEESGSSSGEEVESSAEESGGSSGEDATSNTLVSSLEEPRLFFSTPFDDYTVSEGLLLSILLALVFGALWKFIKEVL